ncbi:MAG: DUF262 domain-containing protein [Chloroflexi bacterium]|nr:DUF262 domain-containing protein [Chloroflexota bacterium]MYF80759.1 DUF262 domain-containing protein [Chloroflexota bacterium]MYI05429.1 DUF262 domain-containing protein [Chloroflexota bacterium]
MRNQPEPRSYELLDLIRRALDGTLVLPEFQRDFVWKPTAVKLLLSSVAKGWPIGSFMLWRPDDFTMAVKDFDGVGTTHGEGDDTPTYLLDGQQRLTALIHAFDHQRTTVKYVLSGAGEYLLADLEGNIEDLVDHRTEKQFGRGLTTTKGRAREDIALIEDIVDDGRFSQWVEDYFDTHKLDSSKKPILFERRAARLPGLRAYSVPAVELASTLDLEAVARIFETTNKTGVKLSTVDLMTARLYPADFRLRDEWTEVQERTYPMVGQNFSDTIDAEDVLRILAYWSTDGAGVTRERILKLSPDFVKMQWARGVSALGEAMTLLSEVMGVVQGSLLPARLMVLPVAVALDAAGEGDAAKAVDREDLRNMLESWFWRAIIDETFARSTNTRAIGQAKELVRRVEEQQYSMQSVLNEEAASGLIDRLIDPKASDGLLEAAAHALVVAADGQDWKADEKPLREKAGTLEKHHIVPREGEGVEGWEKVNCIANMTPQSKESNIELGKKLPGEAGVAGKLLGPHFCDVGELGQVGHDGFDSFVSRRAREIASALIAKAKRDTP